MNFRLATTFCIAALMCAACKDTTTSINSLQPNDSTLLQLKSIMPKIGSNYKVHSAWITNSTGKPFSSAGTHQLLAVDQGLFDGRDNVVTFRSEGQSDMNLQYQPNGDVAIWRFYWLDLPISTHKSYERVVRDTIDDGGHHTTTFKASWLGNASDTIAGTIYRTSRVFTEQIARIDSSGFLHSDTISTVFNWAPMIGFFASSSTNYVRNDLTEELTVLSIELK